MRFMQVFCVVGVLGAQSGLAVASSPEIVNAPVHKVFAPLGFDDNDNSELVVHGEFINSCYKVHETKATVDKEKKIISLTATAYHYKGGACASMLVPFIQSVRVGILPEGSYQVVVNGSPNAATLPLQIAHTDNDDADDYLYAPVEQAALVQNYRDDSITLELSGHYPYMLVGCMQLVDVQTEVTAGNVLVVRPIAEIRPEGDCSELGQFKRRIALNHLTPGEYLVHARALAQTSVNSYALVVETK